MRFGVVKNFLGNIMYPKIDWNYPEDTFSRMSHFLLQSLSDANDWQEAENPYDLTNLRFKSKPGYPGLCVRDIIGIHNTCLGLKGWLLWRKEQGGLK